MNILNNYKLQDWYFSINTIIGISLELFCDMHYKLVYIQALIIYKGEHKVEETSSHKIPTQKMKFNSKQKHSDPSYESISDNKESIEVQVRKNYGYCYIS